MRGSVSPDRGFAVTLCEGAQIDVYRGADFPVVKRERLSV
jgi:hypothetical protein